MREYKRDANCLFCKILGEEIPAEKIYENENVIAILDINPVTPGHALVIPKDHSVNVLDTPEKTLCEISIAVKKVAQAILGALDYEDFNIGVNNGKNAGQIIPHAHWHIIPRREGDGLKHWPHKEYKEGEVKDIAKRIKEVIKIA